MRKGHRGQRLGPARPARGGRGAGPRGLASRFLALKRLATRTSPTPMLLVGPLLGVSVPIAMTEAFFLFQT